MADITASSGFGLENSVSIGAESCSAQTVNVSKVRLALGAFAQRVSDCGGRICDGLYEPGRESDPGRAWAMAEAEDEFRNIDPMGAVYITRAESTKAKLGMFARTYFSIQANRELSREWDARARREYVLTVAANKYDNARK